MKATDSIQVDIRFRDPHPNAMFTPEQHALTKFIEGIIYMTTLNTKFDESGHDEAWRNEVAKELNILLGRALYFRETSNDDSDKAAEEATLSIVQRVRDFEEIKTVEELNPKYPRKVRQG